jgi:hypothetical protein
MLAGSCKQCRAEAGCCIQGIRACGHWRRQRCCMQRLHGSHVEQSMCNRLRKYCGMVYLCCRASTAVKRMRRLTAVGGAAQLWCRQVHSMQVCPSASC